MVVGLLVQGSRYYFRFLQQTEILNVVEEGPVNGRYFGRIHVLFQLFHITLQLGSPVLEPGTIIGWLVCVERSVGMEEWTYQVIT